MIVTTPATTKPPRRAVCPAGSPEPSAIALAQAGAPPPSVDGDEILIRQGDTIDVGIVWTDWLAANDARLKTSAWAADASSPKTPTVTATGIDAPLGQTIAVLDASAAAVGDAYVINNTIVVEDATPAAAGAYAMPERTLKRAIHVRVVL